MQCMHLSANATKPVPDILQRLHQSLRPGSSPAGFPTSKRALHWSGGCGQGASHGPVPILGLCLAPGLGPLGLDKVRPRSESAAKPDSLVFGPKAGQPHTLACPGAEGVGAKRKLLVRGGMLCLGLECLLNCLRCVGGVRWWGDKDRKARTHTQSLHPHAHARARTPAPAWP